MKIDGADRLIKQLEEMHNNIDDDVDTILLFNASDMSLKSKKLARKVMNKGYWTGNLSRMITFSKTGHLSYQVDSDAKYSGFLEYGTRYMSAAPFIYPVYFEINKKLRKDLKRLIG